MNKRAIPAVMTAAMVAVLGFPAAAHAGSGAKSTCSETFAKWHWESSEQPEGGYVTVDIGRNGVDYTSTVWNQHSYISLGGYIEGSTLLVQWHAADGTVLKEKGKGVEVKFATSSARTNGSSSCGGPTTTTPEPTTTAPATTIPETTTTEAPTTTAPAAPETTAPVAPTTAAPTTAAPTTEVPTTLLPPVTPPQRITHDRVPESTTVSTLAEQPSTTWLLPQTGPQQAAYGAVLGSIALFLGGLMIKISRRRPTAA